jgi:hypothetical protein
VTDACKLQGPYETDLIKSHEYYLYAEDISTPIVCNQLNQTFFAWSAEFCRFIAWFGQKKLNIMRRRRPQLEVLITASEFQKFMVNICIVI